MKSMENGHLRAPIFGDARDTGDTVGKSQKEGMESYVCHLPQLSLNGIFSSVLVQGELLLIQALTFLFSCWVNLSSSALMELQ